MTFKLQMDFCNYLPQETKELGGGGGGAAHREPEANIYFLNV